MTFYRGFKFTLPALIILFAITNCSPKKPVDRSEYVKEKEKREVKRLTKAELMVKAEELGKKVLAATASKFQSELKKAISEEGIDGAINYCNLHAIGIASKLEDSLGVSIKRVTDKTRNPADSITAIDREIWEAYTYAPAEKPQIQELDEENFILTKPIMISNGLCLNCHGTPGETITQENYDLIKSKYPDDQAINYQVGDLRGMWRIIIPTKAAVMN